VSASRRPGIPRGECVPMIPPSPGSAPPAFDDNGSGAGQGTAGYGERERPVGGALAGEIEVGPPPSWCRVVLGAGQYAVGNADGELFAVTRRCRHLGADLANGSVDREGCLVCPWHGARYDVATGRTTRGPQGFAKIPGLDAGYRLMKRVLPVGRGVLVEREGTVFVRSHRARRRDDDGRVR